MPPRAWNDTERTYPDVLLHALFESQVTRTPDAPAVRFRNETVSYADLNARANRLAGYLVDAGAGPGTLVAVCMERSVEMVVSLYAILKAGAAYVPVDPDYPPDRIAFMLEDASAPLLLTQRHLRDRLGAASALIVEVDAMAMELRVPIARRSPCRVTWMTWPTSSTPPAPPVGPRAP